MGQGYMYVLTDSSVKHILSPFIHSFVGVFLKCVCSCHNAKFSFPGGACLLSHYCSVFSLIHITYFLAFVTNWGTNKLIELLLKAAINPLMPYQVFKIPAVSSFILTITTKFSDT